MIKIYSTSWCAPCAAAKKMLSELNYTYIEIDIEEPTQNSTGGEHYIFSNVDQNLVVTSI